MFILAKRVGGLIDHKRRGDVFPPVASSLHRVYHSKKRNPKSPKILDSRTKRCDNNRGLIILARGQKKKEYC